jgi:hypothetical protein
VDHEVSSCKGEKYKKNKENEKYHLLILRPNFSCMRMAVRVEVRFHTENFKRKKTGKTGAVKRWIPGIWDER